MNLQIPIDHEKVSQFCRKWQIRELALFGSVLRDDFGADSDVDVMVAFAPDANWGVLEHIEMQDELSELFGRKADLVTRSAIEGSENWIRRKSILDSAQVLHVA